MFAKVFGQIFDSSIAEDYNCRRMFMDLLVLADSDGVVDMTQEAISRRTNVPIEQVVKYIDELSKPDELSRSKAEEGRRLIPVDPTRSWGWQVVNYRHYRKIRDEEARRSYFREKQQQHRAKKKKADNKAVKDASVDKGGHCQTVSSASASSSVFASLFQEEGFGEEWQQFFKHRKLKKAPMTERAQELLLKTLSERPKEAVAAVQMAIKRNWTGFEWSWIDNNKEKENHAGQKPWQSAKDREQADKDAANRLCREQKRATTPEIPRQEPEGFRAWLGQNYSNATKVPYGDMPEEIIREYQNHQ